MPVSLLKTKLYIPQPSPGLVSRPRLLDQLDNSLSKRLLLVSAPAGFGKTTLLAEWLKRQRRSAVWLSIDEGDNDLVRFWTYVVAAFQTEHPDVGEETLALLRGSQQASIEAMLTPLISSLQALSSQLILILDDYHLIENEDVHRSIEFLIEFQPAQILLAIATRQDPPIRLGRLRALGELVEVRAPELRFIKVEARDFLLRTMELDLSDRDVTELETQTEGWIAGLQLAALTLRGRSNPAGYIQSFSGEQRFILDYLAEEVLQYQEKDVQHFLLKTSLLERMSGPLCDALTRRNNGHEMLLMLERANLFLVPLDDTGEWYRYHHLFGEFLRNRLHLAFPNELPELHFVASQWYEANGFTVDAIGHALAARNYEYAAELIESVSRTMMNGQLPLSRILSWLGALPPELVQDRPRLSLMYAWWLVWSAQFQESENRLGDVEKHLNREQDRIDRVQHSLILGEVAAVRANISYASGDIPSTIAYAQQALDRLPPDETLLLSLAALFLGHAYRLEGKPAIALETYQRLMTIKPESLFVPAVVIARGHFPQLRFMQGQLKLAELAHQQTLRFIEEQHQAALPASGITYVDTAKVWYEWNVLEKSAAYLQTGMRLCRHWEALLESQVDAHVLMARIKQAQGDESGRERWLQKAISLGQSHGLPRLAASAEAYQARLWVGERNLAAAWEWVQLHGVSIDEELYYPREVEYLVLVRLLLAEGKVTKAQDLLERLRETAAAAGRVKSQIEIYNLQAIACYAQDDERQALSTLEAAFSLAEPEGYIRSFIDEGEVMIHLLRLAATQGVFPAYATRLLKAAQESPIFDLPVRQPLIEPLTQRELEILGLIAAGLSNKKIADDLVIAESTVKRHIANIYGKLNVGSRTQAIARAQDLNLL